MKGNFKKIALAASFAAFGCNSFINASLNGSALKICATLLVAKGICDTWGLGDCAELWLLLKNKKYAGKDAKLVPLAFKDDKGNDVKPSDELQKLVKDNNGKWIGDVNVVIDQLTLWQLVKDAAKKGSREKYNGEVLKKIMSEVYDAMRTHKIANFEVNKDMKIVETLPEMTIKE